jgi:hypothetical protein
MNTRPCLLGFPIGSATLDKTNFPNVQVLGPFACVPVETVETGYKILVSQTLPSTAIWVLTDTDDKDPLAHALALHDLIEEDYPRYLVDSRAVPNRHEFELRPFERISKDRLFFEPKLITEKTKDWVRERSRHRILVSTHPTTHAHELRRRTRVVWVEFVIGLLLILAYNALEERIANSRVGQTLEAGSYQLLSGQLFTATPQSVLVLNLGGEFDEPGDSNVTNTRLASVAGLLAEWAENPQNAPKAVAVDIACGSLDRGEGQEIGTELEIRNAEAAQQLDAAAEKLRATGTPVFLAAETILPTLVGTPMFYPRPERLAHAVVGLGFDDAAITLADELRFDNNFVVNSLAERVTTSLGAKKEVPPFLDLYLEPDEKRAFVPNQIILGPRYYVNYGVVEDLRKNSKTVRTVKEALAIDVRNQVIVLGNDDIAQDPKQHPLTGDIFSGLFLQAAAIRTKLDSPVYLLKEGTANVVSSILAIITLLLAAFYRVQRAIVPHWHSDKLTYWMFALQFGLALGLAIIFARNFGILWLQYLVMSTVAVLQLIAENWAGLSERIESVVGD